MGRVKITSSTSLTSDLHALVISLPMKPNYRRCVSCHRIAHKQSFWRVVRLYPAHEVRLDEGFGRSAYLCQTPDCLQAARKKNRLAKALKAPVPEVLYQTLSDRLPATPPPII